MTSRAQRSSLRSGAISASGGGGGAGHKASTHHSNRMHATATATATATSGAADKIDRAEEENERRARRGVQKRNSFGPVLSATTATGATSSANQQTLGGVSGYSAAQLADHYASCMKLSAENKISTKNAFQLRLIDYMAETMLKKKHHISSSSSSSHSGDGHKTDNMVENFQAASCALDASTKIYAYRVDSVHSETLRLASGFTSSTKREGDCEAASEMGTSHDDHDEELGNRKRAIKRKKKSATLEKNLNNINCAKFELEFDVDPLFKKVSAQFDSGSGGGQFLATLNLRDDACELLLDSTAKVTMEPNFNDASVLPNQTSIKDVPLPKLPETVQICPTFASFTFRDWSLEKEEALNKSLEEDEKAVQTDYQLHHDEHAFDAAEVVCEDADMDGCGDGDLFDDGVGAPDDDEPSPKRPRVTMALNDLGNIRDHLTTVPNEYSYFDTGRMGAWAGPKHWKFRTLSKSYVPSGSLGEKKQQQKKDKQKMQFDEIDDNDELWLDQIKKAMMLPKKSIKLQSKTMDKWTEEKALLPEDLHYSGKDFVRLEAIPKSSVAPLGAKRPESVDDNVEDYDFDNSNDTQNFCPDIESSQASNYGDGNANPSGDFTNMFSQTGANENDQPGTVGAFANEGGLVSAPNRVEKVQIGFAKFAKKIDMRMLKAVEWTILSEESCMEETNKSQVNNDVEKAVKETHFSDMYQTLKQKDKLPSKMTESLSVPLAFVALLHLCNEQTLQLKSNDKLNDLIVQQG